VVTNVNVSVSYPGGIVLNGMIETDVCADGGDSGGPLMTEFRIGPTYYAYGVGIVSGGARPCSSGTGHTYHQPLGEILEYYGLNLWAVS
jgi:streptogrisin B